MRTPVQDPFVAATRWLDGKLNGRPLPPLVLVVGLGEGHLLDVLEQRAPNTRVLALEPDPAVAQRFRARRDWTSWTTSDRFMYLVGPDFRGADEAWRVFPLQVDSHVTLIDPAFEQRVDEPLVQALRVLKNIVYGARSNAEARRRFAPRYLANTLRNLPAVVNGADVGSLEGAFAGVPAVVAGAGPSLDAALADLRELPGRALLIATDTALRPMLDAGLAPPFVVGVDPGEKNARHFQYLPACPDTWLIAEPSLNRIAVDAFADRAFWFRVAGHQPWPWFHDLGIDVARIEVWGSVLTAAFQFAVFAGCDPIVFAGADLSFTGGRPYARGTTYEFDWTQAVARGVALPDLWQARTSGSPSDSEHVEVEDLRGVPTRTTRTLLSFRDWLLTRAERSGRRVINASGAGMLFGDGVEQGSLRDVLRAPATIASVTSIARRSPRIGETDLVAAVALVREQARSGFVKGTRPGEWAEFCGDGYDAASTVDALDVALRELRHTAPHQRRWAAPLQPRAGIVGLPEREAALRAALSGAPVPAWVQASAWWRARRPDSAATAGDHAAAALVHAMELTGVPIATGPGFFGEDVETQWGCALLDYRFEWSESWRGTLWDYHDALGVVAAAAVPLREPGFGATLAAVLQRIAGDLDGETRACTAGDLRVVHALLREGVYGYNLVSTATGCIAAAQRLGPRVLPEMTEAEVDRIAAQGLLLWAPSEAAMVARIERYLRHIVRLALVHEWATMTDSPSPADLLRKLLHRAAGAHVGSELCTA